LPHKPHENLMWVSPFSPFESATSEQCADKVE
jgi:hypothetical protein